MAQAARLRAASSLVERTAAAKKCITLCIYAVRYEWHDAKNERNQWKHGVTFEMAITAFEDEKCLLYPDRIDEETSELRWHALGAARLRPGRNLLLLIVHVYREDTDGEEIIRLISARKADKSDIRRYQEQKVD